MVLARRATAVIRIQATLLPKCPTITGEEIEAAKRVRSLGKSAFE
jgi:hypothetical protein